MARRATLHSTFTKGVLDPDLSERIDLKHFYDSLAEAENIEIKPQGGFARSPGTMLISDADILAGGYKRRLRRSLTPLHIEASAITAHNGGTAAYLVDQDPTTLFTTTAAGAGTFVVAEVDLGASTPVCFVDVVGFFSELLPKNDVLAVEYYNGTSWVEMTGALEAGASKRRHIRTRGFQAPQTVRLAATKHFDLIDQPVVDDVQTGTGDLVLVKHHADPAKNGVYVVPASGNWSRASIADTKQEVLRAAYYVSEGATNAGTTWVNQQQSLTDLNSFNVNSIITYALAPTQGRTRRFGEWPGGPGGNMISARYWRIVVVDANGAGTISLNGIRFWKEERRVSTKRHFPIDRSAAFIYDLVLSARNVDVFKRSLSGSRRYVASIPVPIAEHQVEEIAVIASRDTVLLMHEDVPTVRIVRQGSDFEWNVDTMPAYNVPALQPGTGYSGDQDEIQEIALPGIVNGATFVLWLGGMATAPITYNNASVAADIASAIDALPGLAAPVVTVIDATPRLRVTFSGSNGARAWPSLEVVMIGATAVAPEFKLVQAGLAANGPFFGAKTGWPRSGFFVQGRVLVAGFRAAPFTWGASAISSFNFQNDPGPAEDSNSAAPPLTADMAFFRTLDTDQDETIQMVFVGRSLQFFTESSEWYHEGRTLDATQPMNAIRATGVGIESGVRAVFAEGATIIVQQGGQTIRDFLFNDVEQSYKAEPLSLLGPHLLTKVVDVGQRKARTTQEANLLYFVNADGTMAVLSLLRAQEVIGMVLQRTVGAWRGVVGHINGDMVFIAERAGADGIDHYLELRDETTLLQSATRVTAGSPFTTVSHLEHLEGQEVWAYAGAQLCGPFTVVGGAISVDPSDAATTITAGLHAKVGGRLQKLRDKLQNDQPFRPPARIYESGLSLKDTGHLEIRANGTEWREVALTFMDGGTLDYGQLSPASTEDGYSPALPVLDRLLTGDVTVENLRGWSKHPTYEFRQVVPAPMHVKAIRNEIAMKG